jgi:hypothetical protein
MLHNASLPGKRKARALCADRYQDASDTMQGVADGLKC